METATEQVGGTVAEDWTPVSWDAEVVNFLDIGERRSLTQEETLLVAVMDQAVTDIRQTADLRKRAEAYWYMRSKEHDYQFSFIAICEHFRISPQAIRNQLRLSRDTVREIERRYPDPEWMRQQVLACLAHGAPMRVLAVQRLIAKGEFNYIESIMHGL